MLEPVPSEGIQGAQAVTESEFMDGIVQVAHLRGWVVAHFRPAQNRRGRWSTPLAYDATGWPDLTLVRDRVVCVEVKGEDAGDAGTGRLARTARSGRLRNAHLALRR